MLKHEEKTKCNLLLCNFIFIIVIFLCHIRPVASYIECSSRENHLSWRQCLYSDLPHWVWISRSFLLRHLRVIRCLTHSACLCLVYCFSLVQPGALEQNVVLLGRDQLATLYSPWCLANTWSSSLFYIHCLKYYRNFDNIDNLQNINKHCWRCCFLV
jgi:hypothetical protein